MGIYSASDMFVNCTYEDNFPTVNLEALACGIPVITYNTGGSPEAVTPSCGAVVAQGDLNGLIQTIQEFKAGKNACVARAKCFDRQHNQNDFIRIYEG